MRKTPRISLLLFLSLFFIFPQTSSAKEKLAVMDIRAKHGVVDSLAEALSVEIRDALHRMGHYEVLSRDDIATLVERTAIRQQIGDDETQQLIHFGKMLGTKYMVAGSISKLGSTYSINLRLIDTEGKDAGVKNRVSEKCRCSEDTLFEAAQVVATKLMGVVGVSAAEPVATGSPPKPVPGQIWTEPKTGLEFVWVEEGCFKMGDVTKQGNPDELPVHKVCVNGFWLGKHEVTQEQWQKVMGKNPSLHQKGGKYPVEQVSWTDVQEFMRLLSNDTGISFRFPTEAEWEYAARSGGKDEFYAGSMKIENVAWYQKNSKGSTNPVGSRSPNGLGIYDMSGNVWEWCSDWYGADYYTKSPEKAPAGPPTGSDRVNRGGSWVSYPKYCRTTARGKSAPTDRSGALGVRLAVSP